MPSSNTLTFDQDPPHRAGVTELGGGAKLNHPNPDLKPDPVTMITAEDFNQFTAQHAAANRVLPLARLFVTFAGGTPSLVLVQALGSNVTIASFAAPVDEGSGQTLITWRTGTGAPAGALPQANGVGVFQNDDTEIDRIRAILTTSGGNPGVRVKTKLGTVGTDANFIVEIF